MAKKTEAPEAEDVNVALIGAFLEGINAAIDGKRAQYVFGITRKDGKPGPDVRITIEPYIEGDPDGERH